MNLLSKIRQLCLDLLTAVQFLTRLPLPLVAYEQDSLARAVKFFPIVGLLIGSGSLLLYRLLAQHLPLTVVGLLVVVYLVAVTGCLHEDGLADSIDAFGGGGECERVLEIMRDSRIGSYGAASLALSLLARVLLIASLPPVQVAGFLIVAPVLSRWTTLPLSFFLSPARERSVNHVDGQGARIASLTSFGSLIVGSLFAFVIAFLLLRIRAFIPVLVSVGVTLITASYYKHRIGGVTGDCFGATNQLTEIAVYLCGVWA
jgi:adenosylcobinamide-GDP ribazoletransferase